jgi:hypothetical protein
MFGCVVNEGICCFTGTYADYVFSKDSYSTVTSQSPMFAVDCEMVWYLFCFVYIPVFALTHLLDARDK